jgi:hypothetical protein
MTQMDQEAQLAVGDVALVDAARLVTYLFSGDWLTLRLPRKSMRSHFGFEPQGGVSRQRTLASRLLFDLVRNADMEAASSSADIYMQFAVYDLVGALFAPSDHHSTPSQRRKTVRVGRHLHPLCRSIHFVDRVKEAAPWTEGLATEAQLLIDDGPSR